MTPKEFCALGRCNDIASKVHHVLIECSKENACWELTMDGLADITGCSDHASLSDALQELQEGGLVDINPRKLYLQE